MTDDIAHCFHGVIRDETRTDQFTQRIAQSLRAQRCGRGKIARERRTQASQCIENLPGRFAE